MSCIPSPEAGNGQNVSRYGIPYFVWRADYLQNAKQPKEVLAQVPLDRLLIETDSPYLTPHPFRGKRNETAYVKLVAEAAAEIRGCPMRNWPKLPPKMRWNDLVFNENESKSNEKGSIFD